MTNIWESVIEIRTGRSPWGDFAIQKTMFTAVPPKDLWFIGGGVEHSALHTEGGRTIALSYYTDGEDAKGLHLVTYRFAQDQQGN